MITNIYYHIKIFKDPSTGIAGGPFFSSVFSHMMQTWFDLLYSWMAILFYFGKLL